MSGFLRQIVSIVGFLAGLLVAMMLYSVFGDWLAPCIGTDVSVGRALAFVLLWIGIPIILLWIARILTRTIEAVSLGGLNRLGRCMRRSAEIHDDTELRVECGGQGSFDFRREAM